MPTTTSSSALLSAGALGRTQTARLPGKRVLLPGLAAMLGVVAFLVAPAVPAAAIAVPPSGGDNSGVQAIDKAVDGHAHLDAISCPTTTWCMAGSQGGTVVVDDAGFWGPATRIFSATDGLNGLSCPTATFCMAVSYLGGYSIFSSGKWSKPVASPAGWGVTCPTTSFCLVEEGGFADIEAWDKGKWSLSFDTEDDPNGGMGQSSTPLSCVTGTTAECAYVDNGEYYTAYNGSWGAMELIPTSAGNSAAVSCSEEPLAGVYEDRATFPVGKTPTCTFVDLGGYAFTLHGSKWTAEGEVDNGASTPGLVAVSCVYGRCAAVDQSRNVLYQDLFSGPTATWSQPFALKAAGVPTAISCASLASCVVVTAAGNAVILDPDD